MNKHDPLALRSSDNGRELFKQFSAMANGFTNADVLNAAINLVVNCIRQSQATRMGAMSRSDQIAAQVKQALDGCYDNAGNRRNVFAFDQNVNVDLVDLNKGRKWPKVG